MKIPSLLFQKIHIFGLSPLNEYRLQTLIHCCNEHGKSTVKLQTLADRWHVSYRQAQRVMQEFRDKGVVQVVERYVRRGGKVWRVSNLYHVMVNFGAAALNAARERVKLAREAYERKKAAMKRAGTWRQLILKETIASMDDDELGAQRTFPAVDYYERTYGKLPARR